MVRLVLLVLMPCRAEQATVNEFDHPRFGAGRVFAVETDHRVVPPRLALVIAAQGDDLAAIDDKLGIEGIVRRVAADHAT